MATPRRHYFYVADQVGHEGWSDSVVATTTRLMAHLHERWARDGLSAEEANSCRLPLADLMRITGRLQIGEAIDCILAVAQRVSIRVEINGVRIPIESASPGQVERDMREIRGRYLGDTLPIRKRNWCESVSITWPKFAEFQGLHPRNEGDLRAPPRPRTAAPVTVTVTGSKEEEKKTPSESWPPDQSVTGQGPVTDHKTEKKKTAEISEPTEGSGARKSNSGGKASWLKPYDADWQERFGGSIAIGEACKALAPIRAKHGDVLVRPVWQFYLQKKDGEFCSPTDFAKRFFYWRDQMQRSQRDEREFVC